MIIRLRYLLWLSGSKTSRLQNKNVENFWSNADAAILMEIIRILNIKRFIKKKKQKKNGGSALRRKRKKKTENSLCRTNFDNTRITKTLANAHSNKTDCDTAFNCDSIPRSGIHLQLKFGLFSKYSIAAILAVIKAQRIDLHFDSRREGQFVFIKHCALSEYVDALKMMFYTSTVSTKKLIFPFE